VIGGGAAGLFAAARAAAKGARVLLLEKMNRIGTKLLITGGGRCNLTNIAPLPEFLRHFNPGERFLKPAFSRFFTDDLVRLLEELGVPIVSERGGRIFPETNKSEDVVKALAFWNRKNGVEIRTGIRVKKLLVEQDRIIGVLVQSTPGKKQKTPNKNIQETCLADSVILATGGASYPGTGSTGEGYKLANSVGHPVIPIRPSLVPLVTKGSIAPRLQGLTLKNVMVRLFIEGKKKKEQFGEMLFTHFGLSGPAILSLSLYVVDALRQNQKPSVSIDLKSSLDHKKLDARLVRDFDQYPRRTFQNILKELLPSKLIPVCVEQTGIAPEKKGAEITSTQRKLLRLWLKDFRFDIAGHRGFKEAIITAGGVDTKTVNPRNMESRLVKGLYFAGEILDISADTGGYNLQAAFSTGWIAGDSVNISS